MKRFFDLVQLERFDDRFNLFHDISRMTDRPLMNLGTYIYRPMHSDARDSAASLRLSRYPFYKRARLKYYAASIGQGRTKNGNESAAGSI
jgi:hypothetical protein